MLNIIHIAQLFKSYGNTLENFESKSSDYLAYTPPKQVTFIDRKSEFQSQYDAKPHTMPSKVPSHLRTDRLHSNNEKNVNHIFTNDGKIITYIPNEDRNNIDSSKRNYSIIS